MILQMFPLKCKLKKNSRSFGEKNSKLKPDPKKLKPKSKKTQKAPTPVEMSCQKNVQPKPLHFNPWYNI